jgi:putative endonuclease
MAAWVYILANRRRGTLYVGSTDTLGRRIWEHKEKLIPGFTTRYGVTQLVYYEAYDLLMDARHRERSMKRWRRAWKIELIESFNPEWRDLYFDLNK